MRALSASTVSKSDPRDPQSQGSSGFREEQLPVLLDESVGVTRNWRSLAVSTKKQKMISPTQIRKRKTSLLKSNEKSSVESSCYALSRGPLLLRKPLSVVEPSLSSASESSALSFRDIEALPCLHPDMLPTLDQRGKPVLAGLAGRSPTPEKQAKHDGNLPKVLRTFAKGQHCRQATAAKGVELIVAMPQRDRAVRFTTATPYESKNLGASYVDGPADSRESSDLGELLDNSGRPNRPSQPLSEEPEKKIFGKSYLKALVYSRAEPSLSRRQADGKPSVSREIPSTAPTPSPSPANTTTLLNESLIDLASHDSVKGKKGASLKQPSFDRKLHITMDRDHIKRNEAKKGPPQTEATLLISESDVESTAGTVEKESMATARACTGAIFALRSPLTGRQQLPRTSHRCDRAVDGEPSETKDELPHTERNILVSGSDLVSTSDVSLEQVKKLEHFYAKTVLECNSAPVPPPRCHAPDILEGLSRNGRCKQAEIPQGVKAANAKTIPDHDLEGTEIEAVVEWRRPSKSRTQDVSSQEVVKSTHEKQCKRNIPPPGESDSSYRKAIKTLSTTKPTLPESRRSAGSERKAWQRSKTLTKIVQSGAFESPNLRFTPVALSVEGISGAIETAAIDQQKQTPRVNTKLLGVTATSSPTRNLSVKDAKEVDVHQSKDKSSGFRTVSTIAARPQSQKTVPDAEEGVPDAIIHVRKDEREGTEIEAKTTPDGANALAIEENDTIKFRRPQFYKERRQVALSVERYSGAVEISVVQFEKRHSSFTTSGKLTAARSNTGCGQNVKVRPPTQSVHSTDKRGSAVKHQQNQEQKVSSVATLRARGSATTSFQNDNEATQSGATTETGGSIDKSFRAVSIERASCKVETPFKQFKRKQGLSTSLSRKSEAARSDRTKNETARSTESSNMASNTMRLTKEQGGDSKSTSQRGNGGSQLSKKADSSASKSSDISRYHVDSDSGVSLSTTSLAAMDASKAQNTRPSVEVSGKRKSMRCGTGQLVFPLSPSSNRAVPLDMSISAERSSKGSTSKSRGRRWMSLLVCKSRPFTKKAMALKGTETGESNTVVLNVTPLEDATESDNMVFSVASREQKDPQTAFPLAGKRMKGNWRAPIVSSVGDETDGYELISALPSTVSATTERTSSTLEGTGSSSRINNSSSGQGQHASVNKSAALDDQTHGNDDVPVMKLSTGYSSLKSKHSEDRFREAGGRIIASNKSTASEQIDSSRLRDSTVVKKRTGLSVVLLPQPYSSFE